MLDHNDLENHHSVAARKNLHKAGYVVADIVEKAAVNTMETHDLLFQTDTGVLYKYFGAAWVAIDEIATQAQQEAGTDVNVKVTPGRQHYHPSATKFWFKAGVTGNLLASYNVTSLTDTGTGVVTCTIATDFSGTHYAVSVTVENADASIDAVADLLLAMVANASQAAGSIQFLCAVPNGTAAADPVAWHVLGTGDQ